MADATAVSAPKLASSPKRGQSNTSRRGGRGKEGTRHRGGGSNKSLESQGPNGPRPNRGSGKTSRQQRQAKRRERKTSAKVGGNQQGQERAGRPHASHRQQQRSDSQDGPHDPVYSSPPRTTNSNSLNHLLNFRYETEQSSSSAFSRRRPVRRRGPKFTKEAFLQANCHFVLSPGDHALSLTDADHKVDWNTVEQVFYMSDDISECPICLSPPLAPKITKCGHIFCFACILRYLDTSGRAWARCPLCFESVYKQACKSTKLRVHTPLNAGEKIAFSLVQRSKGSVITFEKGANAGSLLDNIIRTSSGLTKDGKDPLFSRITMTTDIEKVINEERTVLREAFEAEIDPTTKSYLARTLVELAERQKAWLVRFPIAACKPSSDPPPKPAPPSVLHTGPWRVKDTFEDDSPPQRTKSISSLKPLTPKPSSTIDLSLSLPSSPSTSSTLLTVEQTSPSTASSLNSVKTPQSSSSQPQSSTKKLTLNPKAAVWTPSSSSVISPAFAEETKRDAMESADKPTEKGQGKSGRQGSDDLYLFYQASEGQQVYMHSHNYRALKLQFGDEEYFPRKLVGKVIFVEQCLQDQATRKKYRFLQHLPLYSPFTVAMLDLSGTLSLKIQKAVAKDFSSIMRERQRAATKAKRLQEKRLKEQKAQSSAGKAHPHNEDVFFEAEKFDAGFHNGDESFLFPSLPDNDGQTVQAAEPSYLVPHQPAKRGGWADVAHRGIRSQFISPELASSKPLGSAPKPVVWGPNAVPPANTSSGQFTLGNFIVKVKKGKGRR